MYGGWIMCQWSSRDFEASDRLEKSRILKTWVHATPKSHQQNHPWQFSWYLSNIFNIENENPFRSRRSYWHMILTRIKKKIHWLKFIETITYSNSLWCVCKMQFICISLMYNKLYKIYINQREKHTT